MVYGESIFFSVTEAALEYTLLINAYLYDKVHN